ncbi:MAG: sensor histidine kinase, partial [Pseudomonadota bacterium]
MTEETSSRTDALAALSGGLRFRVAVFLSVALLPIGIFAITQTQSLTRTSEENQDRLLVAMTNNLVFGQRRVMERALGVAEALAIRVATLRDDPEACSTFLTDYSGGTGQFSFVGFLPLDGIMACSNAGRTVDFSGFPQWDEQISDPRISVELLPDPEVSEEPVLNINYPVYDEETFTGYLSLSIPVSTYRQGSPIGPTRETHALVTFNSKGEILSSSGDEAFIAAYGEDGGFVPFDSGSNRPLFKIGNVNGEPLEYVAVPVVPNVAYAVAFWDVTTERTAAWPLGLAPIVMWVASVAVAFLALDRLVTRNIRGLAFRMRQFSRDRRLDLVGPDFRGVPDELLSLEQSFEDMSEQLLQDEAQLEDDLRTKNVLLKEVHHRVKNNLQMISSIMNMQIRSARHPETERVLKRLQDRILGLAAVHRNIYKSDDMSQPDAGTLLSEIAAQSLHSEADTTIGIDVKTEFAKVTMYPDQAVPLSLLLSELMANALKHAAAGDGERPWVTARLDSIDERHARLSVANSRDPA